MNGTILKNGITMRWINTAGFEIHLSNGAVILVDPWLDHADIYPLPLSEIDRADYVLLSHIHFDHAQDIAALLKKFPKAKLFVGDLSTDALCQWQHINLNQIYRIHSGERYEFDDLTIDLFAGRHTENARGCYREDNLTNDPQSLSDWYGSMELLNFLITADDGTKIVVWGGMTSPDQKYRLHGLKPDLALMHVSPKQDFSEFVQLIKSMGAQVVIPHHYDLVEPLFREKPQLMDLMLSEEAKRKFLVGGVFSGKLFIEEFRRCIEENVTGSTLMELEHHKWYRFGLAAAVVEQAETDS